MNKRVLAACGAVAVAALLVGCGTSNDEEAAPAVEETGDETTEEAADVPSNPNEGFEDDVIRIGWMGDVTGPTASSQAFNLRGLEAWAEYVNEQGGVLGRQIEIVSRDDEFSAERAFTNFRALVDDERVLALVQVGGAHISEALMPEVDAAEIPLVGPPQSIDAQLENEWVFNNLAHYGDQADVAIPRMAERVGVDVTDLRVVVLQLELPSGDEWNAYVMRTLEEQGGTHVGRVTINVASPDFPSVVAQLRQIAEEDGANAIAMAAAPAHGLGVLQEMDRLDWQIPIQGIHGIAALPVFLEGPEDLLDVPEAMHSFVPCNVDTPGTTTIREFVSGTEWEDDCLHINFTHGWVNGLILGQAIERAAEGGEVSRATLADALRSGPFDVQGLTCDTDWSSSNHSPCVAPFAWDAEQEGLVPVEDFEAWAEFLDEVYAIDF